MQDPMVEAGLDFLARNRPVMDILVLPGTTATPRFFCASALALCAAVQQQRPPLHNAAHDGHILTSVLQRARREQDYRVTEVPPPPGVSGYVCQRWTPAP